jgi:hypothetical protein
MAEDVEHFLVYLFVICSSFEDYLLESFTHLLIGLFFAV